MADYTIIDYPDELLRLSLSFLGVGHFAFIALVCSRFKIAYLANVKGRKITNGESATSSISRAEKYFEDVGTDPTQINDILFLWKNLARYGRVDVMEWAHHAGYSHKIWKSGYPVKYFGSEVSIKAAEYGQLAVLQWLRQNGRTCNKGISLAAAKGGNLSVLQWAKANRCHWNSSICSNAARGGHLSVLRWARENGCP